jgi:hypothetical protein
MDVNNFINTIIAIVIIIDIIFIFAIFFNFKEIYAQKQKKAKLMTKTIKLQFCPDSIENPQEHIELLHKLIWLACNDVIFFGNYNEDKKDWDDNAYPVINCNDKFYYASADAEGFNENDLDVITDMYHKFGIKGADAWIAVKRGIEVLPEYQTPEYENAKQYLLRKSNG